MLKTNFYRFVSRGSQEPIFFLGTIFQCMTNQCLVIFLKKTTANNKTLMYLFAIYLNFIMTLMYHCESLDTLGVFSINVIEIITTLWEK